MGKGAMATARLLGLLSLFLGLAGAADWNIFHYVARKEAGVNMNLKNYCESWRLNVEQNNVQGFDVVPGECAHHLGKYMASAQYRSDVHRAAEECTLFLAVEFVLGADGKDAWVFDVDDTLLSTLPYYKNHNFGGEQVNRTSLEGWMQRGSAPAIKHMQNLYDHIREKGMKIFLISSRGEHLRAATVDNLISAGYGGWKELMLRCTADRHRTVQQYKSEQRKKLVERGYHIWGIVGDQWSSLLGCPAARMTFKLPNPLYYDV